ncbi:hypothetical protein MKK75_07030 [Methylobacterium sp. J-030]|uniref:hypothetical protein n=1 Tax=Methylobacterium sp. J-030 TaxID=2836627 RepID=UPI001FBB3CB9|nr:hypothetical protein [Methylobacterium sp. J-030]MCJ2068559.1 hypothetical protein [Methylobacterium sp. J-030]
MAETIIPLRLRDEDHSALARVDVTAAGMLARGQAATLQAARVEVILADLRGHRDQMTTLLADLRARRPTEDPGIDTANANLVTAINQGVAQIDLFIARAQVLEAEAANSDANAGSAPPEP